MTSDNPLALEIERKELQKALEESARLNSTTEEESSTVSPEEAARIRAEVQAVMKQQFAKARANVLAHANWRVIQWHLVKTAYILAQQLLILKLLTS